MAELKLSKDLFTEINKLKWMNNASAPVRFELEESPFADGEEQEKSSTSEPIRDTIVGLIHPKAGICRGNAYRIEIQLAGIDRIEPTKIRFRTPICHPDVAVDGLFSPQILKRIVENSSTLCLADVIKAVVYHIDNRNPDGSFRIDQEFLENQVEIHRQIFDSMKKQALPLI